MDRILSQSVSQIDPATDAAVRAKFQIAFQGRFA
jgi:hypothetical protein